MTLTLAPRTQKALAVAAGAASWTQIGIETFRIPSQSHPAQSYLTTPLVCSCPAAEKHPEQLCKHSTAVCLVSTLLEQDAPPAPTPPLSEAEVTALFARLSLP